MYGMVHPFDCSQLPLLSSMEFDGDWQDGSQTFQCIRWPATFHEDPAMLSRAVRSSLGGASPSAAVPPAHWLRLLHPSPCTWLDLERCLAKLVEQVVLRANVGAASKGTPACEGRADDPASGEASPEEGKPLTARAAKRLRQRERRKLCRKGFLAAAADVQAAVPAPAKGQGGAEAGDAAGRHEDDGASDVSVSTTAGGRSQSSGDVLSRHEAPEAGEVPAELAGAASTVTSLGGSSFALDGADSDGGWTATLALEQEDGQEAARLKPDAKEDLEQPLSSLLTDVIGQLEAGFAQHGDRPRSDDHSGDGASGTGAGSADLYTDFDLNLDGIDRPPSRQVSCSSAFSERHSQPFQRQSSCRSTCPTPAQLWPDTPEASPWLGPAEAPCAPWPTAAWLLPPLR